MTLIIQAVFSTLIQVIVPLSIPVTAGALLKRFRSLDTRPLSTLYLYFLTPSLILKVLTTAEISFGDVYKTVSFCIVNLILLWAAAKIFGKMFKLPSSEAAGLTLVSTFTNSVNYGLPLVLLAFGNLGLEKASVYVIAQIFIINTVGVYFAARSQFSVKDAVKSVFSLPAVYAALLASALRFFGLHLPADIQTGVVMAAGAYSPVVLAILGAQMVSVNRSQLDVNIRKGFWIGLALRLLISPLISALSLYLLNVRGILFSVLFILSSMPVAVNAVVLAERFNASPKLLSNCILWTTLASFIVLPVLIALVK